MARYQKVEVFSSNGHYQGSMYNSFSSVYDAITSILYHKFSLRYKDLSDFWKWRFRVVPSDSSKHSKEYIITINGNIRINK